MITTLTGDNRFLLEQELGKRIDSFVVEHGDLALERLDGGEATFDQMQGSIESQPFLAAKKLVILRSPSSNQEFIEHFEQLIKRVAQTTNVILLEPKLDKRLAYYRQLKKHTEFLELNKLDDREIPSWLTTQAAIYGGSLTVTDARYLVDRVGVDQQLLTSELQKLLSYNTHITRGAIDLLTEQSPQGTIFQLLDAAFGGNLKRALHLYDEQRRQRVEPLVIMGMIAWQLHALAIVKTAGDKPVSYISREARLSPYVVQKTKTIADKLSMNEVRGLIRRVADLDARLKSTNIDSDEAMQQLLIDISELI